MVLSSTAEGDVKPGPNPSPSVLGIRGSARDWLWSLLIPPHPDWDLTLLLSPYPRFWIVLVTVAAMALCHSQAASCMSCPVKKSWRGVLVKDTAVLSGQVLSRRNVGVRRGWMYKEERENTQQTREFISSRVGCRRDVIWRWGYQSFTWNVWQRFQGYLSSADRMGWLGDSDGASSLWVLFDPHGLWGKPQQDLTIPA